MNIEKKYFIIIIIKQKSDTCFKTTQYAQFDMYLVIRIETQYSKFCFTKLQISTY